MNGISVFKITFGKEIYNTFLVNSLLKIKYFVQGKCLGLFYLHLFQTVCPRCKLDSYFKKKSD